MFKRTKTKKTATVEPTYDFSGLTDGQVADEARRAVEDLDALIREANARGIDFHWQHSGFGRNPIVPGDAGFELSGIRITKTTNVSL